MPVSLVTGLGKGPLQIFRDSDEYQREVVLATDAADLTMPRMLEVSEGIVVAVEPDSSRAMGKYETSGTGIAKVHLSRLYQLGQRLEVSIVQQAVMDHQTGETRQHGEKDGHRMAPDPLDANLWRDHQWNEHRQRQSKTTSGGQR